MATDFDPWALSTGLSDTIRGKITEAFFSFDNAYNNGDTCVLKLVVQDPELGEQTLLYPCGDGWEPYEGGAKTRHSSGDKRNFNHQSGVGLLLKYAAENGLGDLLRSTGHTPFDAALWEGLSLTFKRVDFTFKNKQGEEASYHRMLPVEEYEDEGGKAKTKAKAKVKADDDDDDVDDDAPVQRKKRKKKAGFDTSDLPAKLRGQMKAVAVSADDNEDFIEKLYTSDFDIPEDIEEAVFSGDLYAALRTD